MNGTAPSTGRPTGCGRPAVAPSPYDVLAGHDAPYTAQAQVEALSIVRWALVRAHSAAVAAGDSRGVVPSDVARRVAAQGVTAADVAVALDVLAGRGLAERRGSGRRTRWASTPAARAV